MSDYSAYIAAHCEEVGECIEWLGRYGSGRSSKTPVINCRGPLGERRRLSVPALVWEAEHGPVPAGKLVYRHHCCNWRCVRLEHLRCGRRGDQLHRRAQLGMASHLQSTRAAITASARRRPTTVHSIEQARAVRDLASYGVPDPLIAWATDVSLSMVGDIRVGKAWADQAAAASVFAWRPQA